MLLIVGRLILIFVYLLLVVVLNIIFEVFELFDILIVSVVWKKFIGLLFVKV